MKAIAYWLGASALAIASCGTAQAQETETTQVEDSGEIVVTAQRRNENLMTTAIAASVITGTDLENKGVGNVDALQFATPSLVVNNFGQGNDFNVRGIGKAEHNTQTTTGVIVYRDGVPTFPGYVQGEPYYDIANIQVLRGPQGTIVGQNATGGAVFVNSNDPIIGGGNHGYIAANYGNYNDLGGQAAINLPVSDEFAMRVAVYGQRRDSFYNITGPGGAPYPYNPGDTRVAAGRFSMLWKPVDGLTILSKTDIGYLDFGAYPASPQSHFFKVTPGTNTPNPNYHDLFDKQFNAPQGARDKFVRSTLKVEYQTAGGVRFRSMTGYGFANTYYRADLDGTATGISTFFDDVDEQQVSQEFNIISPDNQRFTWLLGAFGVWNTYHFKEPYQFVIDVADGFNSPLAQYKLQGTNPTHSYAVFGQVGFNITPNLKLDVGGRYTTSQTTNHVDVLQYGTYIRADQTAKSDNFSYKVSLGWKASDDQYLYAFVSTGFRPGGLNVPVGLGLPAPFEPEEVRSYELGWKANWADGRIRTSVTGFYNDYHNFQVIIGYPDFPTFGIELNVPEATRIYGAEAQAEFHFGPARFDVGVSTIHTELGTFYATDPRAASVLPCSPTAGPVSVSCLNLGGREQTYAPDFTFNASASYEFDLGGSTLTPRVNYGHVAAQWATLFQNPLRGDRLPARNIVNAQLAWNQGSWTVTAYATNLTNQHYPSALNSGLYFVGPPRQYGVKLLKTF